MRVDRTKAKLVKTSEQDDGYVDLSPAERVSLMWELTAEVWSLKKSPYVKKKLPRHITRLIVKSKV
jgi:hypothetical protein